MIKNIIVGTEKFVLFIDTISYERIGNKTIEKMIQNDMACFHVPKSMKHIFENQKPFTLLEDAHSIQEKSNVILAPVSKLAQHYEVPEIIRLIHALKKNPKVKQIFGWLTVNNTLDHRVISYLEHMADLVVTLKDSQHLSILTKRASGSVNTKAYQYEITESLDFNVAVIKKAADDRNVTESEVNPEKLTTFKINFDEEELVARNAVKLPYEKTQDKPAESKILYQPDSDDDFDEEDPDEDLYI